ncbi:MAG: FeoA family protein [Gammaproteobacteria bacterium]
MQLGDMKIGSKGLIIKVNSEKSAYRERLVAMGLIPGTQFIVSRIAPLGDPIEIKVRGFALSLRKDEARILEIKEVVA